jgi:ADP-ribosylglycohydrolase
MNLQQRAENCLLGQLIGDALGARYEFGESIFECSIKNQIASDRDEKEFLPMLGGGIFQLDSGQITDDSEMALSLMYSIIDANSINCESINKVYVAWAKSDPFDIGNNTSYIFGNPKNTGSESAKLLAYEFNKKCKTKFNSDNLSNGCLMRLSPICICVSKLFSQNKYDYDKIKDIVSQDTKLSHSSNTTLIATTTYVYLVAGNIAHGINNFQKTLDLVIESAARDQEIRRIVNGAINKDRMSPPPTEKIGYLGTALHLAVLRSIQIARQQMSFHRAITSVIELGGDTDTNGAIVGAAIAPLVSKDAIPIQWINSVLCDSRYKTQRKDKVMGYKRFKLRDVAKLLDIY